MFQNLGRALALLRELRHLSQAALARRAKIGKSQLSKYEGGRELPKFESLEKVLKALEVSAHQFFYVFYFIDSASAMVERNEGGTRSAVPEWLTSLFPFGRSCAASPAWVVPRLLLRLGGLGRHPLLLLRPSGVKLMS